MLVIFISYCYWPYVDFTNNNESLRANGNTNKTVGKAIIHDSPHELIHGDTIISVKPSALTVLIKETIPLITNDKKKGTKKIIARAGSLGIPKM
ncbi:hypothetical protein QQ39_09515 [Pragia fontium]|nr:hypothetical protein QQ39_09515 [Pragia fontium]